MMTSPWQLVWHWAGSRMCVCLAARAHIRSLFACGARRRWNEEFGAIGRAGVALPSTILQPLFPSSIGHRFELVWIFLHDFCWKEMKYLLYTVCLFMPKAFGFIYICVYICICMFYIYFCSRNYVKCSVVWSHFVDGPIHIWPSTNWGFGIALSLFVEISNVIDVSDT